MAGPRTFNLNSGDYELAYGAVYDVIYTDNNPLTVYGVVVHMLERAVDPYAIDSTNIKTFIAMPLNMNIQRIPLINETVLLLKSPSSDSAITSMTYKIYYIDIVSLQSNVSHNTIPLIAEQPKLNSTQGNSSEYEQTESGAVSDDSESDPVDENFQQNSNNKPLQHYVGDTIFQGRFGQSIRFSSTQKNSDLFTKAPNWSEGTGPITIIRNTKQATDTGKINDFVTEDFTNDDSIIVLSSDQKLNFEEGSKVSTSLNSKGITSWRDSAFGESSQILLSSRRLIFNSSQNEIVAFAKTGIALSTETSVTIDAQDDISLNANRVEIGTDASEQMLLGNAFQSWMEKFIDTLSLLTVITPTGPASPLTSTPQWTQIETLKSQLPDLLSEIGFISKTTSVTIGQSNNRADRPPPERTSIVESSQPDETAAAESEQRALEETDPEVQATYDLESNRFRNSNEPGLTL